jgi:hypothetical protein
VRHTGFKEAAASVRLTARSNGAALAIRLELAEMFSEGSAEFDAILHQSLLSLPMGSLRNNNQISHLGPLNGQYR